MEASYKTVRSNSIHYNDVYSLLMTNIRQVNDLEKAVSKVTEKLLTSYSEAQILKLKAEVDNGMEGRLKNAKLDDLQIHLIVSQIISGCAAVYSSDMVEVNKVSKHLSDGDIELAYKAAKEISLQNKQRDTVFTNLAKMFLVLEDFPKAKDSIQEIASEVQRNELFVHLKTVEKSPRDFEGYVIQVKLGTEVMGFKSTCAVVGEKLKPFSYTTLKELMSQNEGQSHSLHPAPHAVVFADQIAQGARHLLLSDPLTYEDHTKTLFNSIIRAKNLEQISDYLTKGQVSEAVSLADAMDKQSKITVSAYLKIIEHLKQRGEFLVACEVVSHMPDGDKKVEIATELLKMKTKSVVRDIEQFSGETLPSNFAIDHMFQEESEKAKKRFNELAQLDLQTLKSLLEESQVRLAKYRSSLETTLNSRDEQKIKRAMDLKFAEMNEQILLASLIERKEKELQELGQREPVVEEKKTDTSGEKVQSSADTEEKKSLVKEKEEKQPQVPKKSEQKKDCILM